MFGYIIIYISVKHEDIKKQLYLNKTFSIDTNFVLTP